MSTTDVERLRSIKTFPSLVKYLRDELDWPIELDSFEDLDPVTYDYTPEELGLDSKMAVKIKQIKRLRRLCPNQPWGIFFVNFVPKRLPVTVLRRILQQLVPRKRESARRPDQKTWQPNDLLFVSAYGEDEQRQISFAHFTENKQMGDLPVLKVLGWDKDDTAFHLADAHDSLKEKLSWPDNEENVDNWRRSWSSAFILRHREVVDTSRKLAIELADLAISIRRRVNQVLAVEDPEKGPMRKLMAGFKEALIHDLEEDDFADMYAQTVAYGLLAAAISRHVPGEGVALIADNIADMVPVTNPFLKELLSTFLTVGGRQNKLDFDELGINDIIELLRSANLTAVLHDFGNQNPLEDPVIHFYELFLKEYDASKRTQRGVFYTPKPVVSFIVRSVHEILKKDFGLKYGLADTTTWGKMAEHEKRLAIPEGTRPEEPFVQILDPATGTGTFLVEVIDIVYKTMTEQWEEEGHMPLEYGTLWNEYVPNDLLPRLNGFELLMAPYTIAHMKVGLKLKETGYRFQSNERARVYLTNTLEKPKEVSGYFETMAPALANEARAANRVKERSAITVIIGNPPYSQYSENLSPEAKTHIEKYRYANGKKITVRNPLQLERNINDDYVKFFGFSSSQIAERIGVLGFITNRMFLDSESLVGLRESFCKNFSSGLVVDLHGDMQASRHIDRLKDDQNVFEISQGVAITILARRYDAEEEVFTTQAGELIGDKDFKSKTLLSVLRADIAPSSVEPQPENWWLDRSSEDAESGTPLSEIMPEYATLVASNRDHMVVNFEVAPILENVRAFADFKGSNESLSEVFGITLKKNWNVNRARKRIAALDNLEQYIQTIEYRPYDRRSIFFHKELVWQTCPIVSKNIVNRPFNLILVSLGKNRTATSSGYWVTKTLADKSVVSTRDNASGFPLYVYASQDSFRHSNEREVNLNDNFVQNLTTLLGLKWLEDGRGSMSEGIVGPEDVFHYMYAQLYSNIYRNSQAEALCSAFPSLFIVEDCDLFKALSALGANLVALHLLDDGYQAASWNSEDDSFPNPFNSRISSFPVEGNNFISKVGGKDRSLSDVVDNTGRLFINEEQYFDGIPKDVWEFSVGCHQVCYKWLESRKKAGRKLSQDDIGHYQRIILAINETIKIMKQIDETIEAHGGWPIE